MKIDPTNKEFIQFVINCYLQKSRGDGILYNILNEGSLFYDVDSGSEKDGWYFWNDIYWETDNYNFRLAEVEACSLIYEKVGESIKKHQAEETGFKKFKANKLFERADFLRTTKGRNACISFATSNIRISERGNIKILKKSDAINQKPHIVPCNNAVIDLRKNEAIIPNPSHYMTNHLNVFYDPYAECPKFKKNMYLIYDGDEELIQFVQKLFGIALYGKVEEHLFIIFNGNGRNGKGLLLEDIILSVFGTFGLSVSENLLVESSYVQSANSPTPAMLSFLGKRFALSSESTSRRNFHAELVKRLTGGDSIVARAAYEKFNISFKPTHTLFFMTNTIPYVDPLDNAFWKRVVIVPHYIQFEDKPEELLEKNERKKDITIAGQLLEEKPGILNWILEGYQLYRTQGLVYPNSVLSAISEYRDDVDTTGIRQFMKEFYEFDESSKVLFSDAYGFYVRWYEENVSTKDKHLPSKRTFGSRLRKYSKHLKVDKIGGDTYIFGVTSKEIFI